MSIQSLVEQVANPDTIKVQKYMEWVPLMGPMPIIGQKKYFHVWKIKCLDKQEKEQILKVTSKTQIKITTKDKFGSVFYFGTIKIKDGTITGFSSRILRLQIEPIKVTDILKVEIQRGVPQSNKIVVQKTTETINLEKYNSLIKEADAAMLKKQYDIAISKYSEASALFPQKSYPKMQVEKAKSLIK